jgi:hypothetical protein
MARITIADDRKGFINSSSKHIQSSSTWGLKNHT